MGIRSFIKSKAKKVALRAGGTAGGGQPSAAEAIRDAMSNLPPNADAEGYRAVAPSDVVKDGEGNTFLVDGHNVAVFRVEGAVHVVDDECLHENGPLGEGHLEGHVVVCPYHDWRYDVRTGDCITEPARHLACYAARERDGYIWVGRRTRESSGERGGEHDDGLNSPIVQVD